MRRHITCFYLLLGLFLGTASFADERSTLNRTKIGTNMLSLLLIGDLNGSFERPLARQFTFVATAHYVGSSKLVSAEGEGYRFSAGLRSYGILADQDNGFLEFKTGVSHYTDSQGDDVTNERAPLSIEFYGGVSNIFNDMLYYEMKLGLIRFVRSGEVSLGAGYNVGIMF